jgi:DNA-binding CsgD family transcriptional regulator
MHGLFSVRFRWLLPVSESVRLAPRQLDCLRLVWERQATSKEIAAELGIAKGTVDNYIKTAVEMLGARDRRDAAQMLFGGQPRNAPAGQAPDFPAPAEYTIDSTGVGTGAGDAAAMAPSTSSPWPWRSGGRRNSMTLAQTLLWIAVIGFAALCALSLAVSVGNGLRPLAQPVLRAFDRLTH